MNRILEPASTLAVVIGAHDWSLSGLEISHAFSNSAKGILHYLSSAQFLGLPAENICNLFDDERGASDQLKQVGRFLRSRVDARARSGHPMADLLFYYVGHGAFRAGGGEFMLLVRSTDRGFEYATSLNMRSIAECLQNTPELRRFMVLDCCFAGAAAGSIFQGGEAAIAAQRALEMLPRKGTLLMCSSSGTMPSRTDETLQMTRFSGALVHALRQGSRLNKDQYLSFEDAKCLTWTLLRERYGGEAVCPELHEPVQLDGGLRDLPAFPNPAVHRIALGVVEAEHEIVSPAVAADPGRLIRSLPADETARTLDVPGDKVIPAVPAKLPRWIIYSSGCVLLLIMLVYLAGPSNRGGSGPAPTYVDTSNWWKVTGDESSCTATTLVRGNHEEGAFELTVAKDKISMDLIVKAADYCPRSGTPADCSSYGLPEGKVVIGPQWVRAVTPRSVRNFSASSHYLEAFARDRSLWGAPDPDRNLICFSRLNLFKATQGPEFNRLRALLSDNDTARFELGNGERKGKTIDAPLKTLPASISNTTAYTFDGPNCPAWLRERDQRTPAILPDRNRGRPGGEFTTY
jgi:hypothetical protein